MPLYLQGELRVEQFQTITEEQFRGVLFLIFPMLVSSSQGQRNRLPVLVWKRVQPNLFPQMQFCLQCMRQ